MHVRYPVWLRTAQQRPGATVFALLFGVESLARALLATVITVQALELLGNVRDVSALFSTVGVSGLVASFSIPWLVRRFGRRAIYTAGAALLVLAATLLATLTVAGQAAGMLARVYGTACLNITLSLFILQHIRRAELTVSEPRRLQFSALAWTVGPGLGVVLYERLGHLVPYVVSGLFATGLIVLFWVLQLSDERALRPARSTRGRSAPRSPWHLIGRFVVQPRLRLAWLLVFGRSSWWVFFFIYTAAYAVQRGLGAETGAMIVSAGNGMLFLAPRLGRLASARGVRAVLGLGFLIAGSATLAAAFAFETPAAVVALLLAGSIGAVCLDSVGNIPFLAAVRSREREEMTTVFRTYIDASDLLPPALFAVVLTFFDLRAVFLIQGLCMLVLIGALAWLPPRLGRSRIVQPPASLEPAPTEGVAETLAAGR